MNWNPDRLWIVAVAVLLAVLCAVAGGYWLARPLDVPVSARLPGMDGRPAATARVENVKIGSLSRTGPGVAAALPGEWPGFRGSARDNRAMPAAPLAESWGPDGPPVLWSLDLGEGHAGPAVAAGRVYLLDYDENQRADILRCLSLEDGRILWERGYRVHIKRNHGFSRTVPCVGDGVVVTIGPRCHVMAVDAVSGEYLWGIDMVREFGAGEPDWYTGQCPLIDRGQVVLAPCGTNALMVGLDCRDGKTAWTTPLPGKWRMSHASVMVGTIAGKRMYVYAGINGMAGVSAEAGDAGRLLWKTEAWTPAVIVPSPVLMGDGRIFLTAGYGSGSMVVEVKRGTDGEFDVSVVRRYGPRDGFASEQQTPVEYGGCLFGVLPKDAGPGRNQFACADALGTILWTSGPENRFGLGPVLIAADRFLVLSDEGVLTMARAATDGWKPMAQAKVLQGHDSWGPMALAGTRLLLRDSKRMICLELKR